MNKRGSNKGAIDVYRCSVCGKWHLGRRPPGIKKSEKKENAI